MMVLIWRCVLPTAPLGLHGKRADAGDPRDLRHSGLFAAARHAANAGGAARPQLHQPRRNAADSRWKFRRAGKTETIQTHGRYAANHTAVRLDAVKQHLGIGSLPLFTARDALARGDIVQVLAEWEFISSYSGQLWLLWSGNNICPPECGAMIDYLSEKIDGRRAAYGARANTSATQR